MTLKFAGLSGTLAAVGTSLFPFFGESNVSEEKILSEESGVNGLGVSNGIIDSVINTSGNKDIGEKVKEKGNKGLEERKKKNSSNFEEEEKLGKELDTVQEIGRKVRGISTSNENSEKDKGVWEAEIVGTKFSDGFKLSEESTKKVNDMSDLTFDNDFSKTQNFGFRTNGVWGAGFDNWAKTNLNKSSEDLELRIQTEKGKVTGFHEYSIGRGTYKDSETTGLWGDKSGEIKWTVIGRDLDLERRDINGDDEKVSPTDVCVGTVGKKGEKGEIPEIYGEINGLTEMDRFLVMDDFRSGFNELIQMGENESFGLKPEDDDSAKTKILQEVKIETEKNTSIDYKNFDVGTQGNGKMMCLDGKNNSDSNMTDVNDGNEKQKPNKGGGGGRLGRSFLFEKNLVSGVKKNSVKKKKFTWGWGGKRNEIFEIIKDNPEYTDGYFSEGIDVEKKKDGSGSDLFSSLRKELENGIHSGNGRYRE